ncbi:MAG: hypothetical protein A3B77_01340 [Candidatus Doudnabacteria bacterium RIFCSPHIGHO2_02_FULL_49_24]|nr:MAG: hypothetical protein A3B77_01340 [Candidatus Doudnabacteria bacterium RIFCSPHIGHO2_02_FULL_49_24]
MKKFKVFGLAAVVLALAASPVLAAEFIAPESKTDANISTLQQDVHKNLYIAGAAVTINGKIQGDLAAAGGVVTVNGDVEKGLLLAGGNLNLNAAVGENARIAGGNVSINAPVGGDLLVGGGNITIAQKAKVGGDLVIGGGNVLLDADVAGNVKIGGGNVTINGKVSGNVEVMANQNLTFGPASQVLGKVSFKGPQEAVVKPGAKVGVITYTHINKRVAHRSGIIGLLIIGSLFKLIMLLVAAVVLAWLLPSKISAVVAEAKAKPWHSLGFGVLVVILSPILGVILMATVLGIYLGMIVFMIFGLLMIISAILSLFYVGNQVWSWYHRDAIANLWRDLGLGALITLILGFIPIVGWVILLVIWLITLGALKRYTYQEAFGK